MKRIVLILLCFVAFPLMASHIVGGEFEIVHLGGNQYRVNLILYFDELNGQQGARDPNVSARIFRKIDNFPMRMVILPLTSQEPVTYMQPACSKGEIVTTKIIYTTVIVMTDAEYNHPDGYYISWERCCRNYTITNIYSQDPNTGGTYAGQTFYLEFPPVVKNGQPFYNSTPRLFPPLNDYACPYKPYYVDFAGTDDDGDSLVYSLVTPLNTKSGDALPPGNAPRPRPYPEVNFRPGYSAKNFLQGAPDLSISDDGFLSVTPTTQGLFVFAVKCEEYRNKVKIGEVRRDFQMLVLDKCGTAEKPLIKGKRMDEAAFTHIDNMTVSFSNSVNDEDRCIQVEVSDKDASMNYDNFEEKIRIRAIPIGHKINVSNILPSVTTATLQNGSTKVFDICFDRCPLFESGVFQVGIVVFDDACSQPLTDTLRINVTVEPPTNTKPYFTTPNVTQTVNEGDEVVFPIHGLDDELNPLSILVKEDDFDFANVGMTLNQKQLTNGLYEAELVWDTKCDVYDFRFKQDFHIELILEDLDECNFNKGDTMKFDLQVKLPGNADPVISTNLSEEEVANGITRKVFESIEFEVYGTDPDDNLIVLGGDGVGFSFASHNMTFPGDDGLGLTGVSSTFRWDLDCNNLDLKTRDEFDLRFIVVDEANKCRIYQADTLELHVKVLPPENQAPNLEIVNLNPELTFTNYQQSILLGQQISLALTSSDPDFVPTTDEVSIELIKIEGSGAANGYIFSPVTGNGSASTNFTWLPDCSIFSNNVWENNYKFTFRTKDNRCFNIKGDTIEVDINIKDIDQKVDGFIPPNYVTPNGDSRNDFFGMYRFENESADPTIPGSLVNILPIDNCAGRFLNVSIYNRWGAEVFFSEDREFKWYPDEAAVGVYFYTLKFTDKEFKGSISVRR